MLSTRSSFQNLQEVLSTPYNQTMSKSLDSLIFQYSHPRRPKPGNHLNSMLSNSQPSPRYHPANCKYSSRQDLTISTVSVGIFPPAYHQSNILLIWSTFPTQVKYIYPQKTPSGFSIAREGILLVKAWKTYRSARTIPFHPRSLHLAILIF